MVRGSLFIGLLWLLASPAHAEPLRVDHSAEAMRVDGALREWRGAHFAELGSGDDASVRYALASADQGLYVGAEVRDERLITGTAGDALVLTLALPVGEGPLRPFTLTLHPGQSGRTAALALVSEGRRAARVESRVAVVEGPRSAGTGYVLEALVPWAVLGEAAVWKSALWEQARGSLSLRDVDGKGAVTMLASATAKQPSELPRLAPGTGQRDLLGSFLSAKELAGVEPRFDFRANVAGDARPERVAIVDRYVLVYGPGYAKGETSVYFELPYGLGGSLEQAELLDFTADGQAELAVRVRQQESRGARTLWMVLALEEPRIVPIFSIEVKKERESGFVENALQVVTKGQRTPRVDVALARSEGLDAQRYREPPARDVQPILLPWGDVEARSFAFDGARFVQVDEQRRVAPKVAAKPVIAAPVPTEEPVAREAADPLAAYKRKVGLPTSAKPSRALLVNLLPGRPVEHVALFGTELVITGDEVGEGRAYVSYGLPIADPGGLLELRPVALSGGPADELLVRVRQPLTGAAGVEREVLVILRAEAGGRLVRALVAEVARRMGERAIENRLSVRAGALVREPGAARGWSAESYPFDAAPIGGAERLLLPWSDRPVHYRTEGSLLRADMAAGR